jgi:NAD(P)H-hydrate epimerase
MKSPMNAWSFSRAALREVDRRALEEYRIPVMVLMENAGRAVAEAALHHLKPNSSILVVAGPGNNGGDGLVAARHLHNAAYPVEILTIFDPRAPLGPSHAAVSAQLAILAAMKLSIHAISADHAEIRDWIVDSQPHDFIIDALFGTGLSREVTGLPRDVIHALNLARRTILSIDIPSGLDAATGQPLGIAVKATQTVSFCGTKTGFAHPAAKLFIGKLTIADIGAPRELLQELSATPSAEDAGRELSR